MTIETASLDSLLDDTPTPQISERSEPAPAPAEMGVKPEDAAPPADVERQAAAKSDDGPTVPRKALEDERRKRQEMERRLAELEATAKPKAEAPPAPDPWSDPEGALRYQAQEFERRIFTSAVLTSQRILKAQHADYDEVESVFAEAAAADPRLAAELVQHPFPAEFAYQQGKRIQAMREIGDDPTSYKSRLEAELEAKILAKHGLAPGSNPEPAPRSKAPAAPVPRSLASTVNQQPRDESGKFTGRTPLEDIIG